jgi:hypothetical protein
MRIESSMLCRNAPPRRLLERTMADPKSWLGSLGRRRRRRRRRPCLLPRGARKPV